MGYVWFVLNLASFVATEHRWSIWGAEILCAHSGKSYRVRARGWCLRLAPCTEEEWHDALCDHEGGYIVCICTCA